MGKLKQKKKKKKKGTYTKIKNLTFVPGTATRKIKFLPKYCFVL